MRRRHAGRRYPGAHRWKNSTDTRS
jgi:hypothetical protein